jgi:hypothetical protein
MILWGGTLSAQDGVLPGDQFSDGWRKSGDVRRYDPYSLYNHIDGGAELFLEFGFESLLVQYYALADQELTLEVYRMKSPESALGVYLMKCGEETPIPGILARNSGNRFQFIILKGRFFIQIYNADGKESLIPVMVDLTHSLLKSIPEEASVTLFTLLPKENLIPASERLIRGPTALEPIFTFGRGDVLQLGGQVFGVLGDYKDPSANRYTQILIPYPGTEDAQSAYANLIANLDSYITIRKQDETSFVFQDYKNQFGKVTISGSRIIITIHLSGEPGL